MGFNRPHWRMFVFFWLACLAAGFFSSCAPLRGQNEDEKGLLLAVERFSKDIRWGDYKSAMAWIEPSAKEEFWGLADRLYDSVRIIDYQIVDVGLNGSSAKVSLRYRFYQKQDPRIQTRTLHQHWLFSDQDRAWQVVRNDLRKLMPD
jgi:hypothetical protein